MRDPILRPKIDPPDVWWEDSDYVVKLSAGTTRQWYPGAVEVLEEISDDSGSLSIYELFGHDDKSKEPLVFETDRPSEPLWWDPETKRWWREDEEGFPYARALEAIP